jgi:hypothetical protein
MRSVVAWLVASAAVPGLLVPAVAAPPDDLGVYCRANNPQMQSQVRCLYTEKAAQDRLARARPGVDPALWSRCQSASPAWTAMETCLAPGSPPDAGPGLVPAARGEGPVEERADPRAAAPETAATPGGPDGVTPAAAAPAAPAPLSSPSTIILGPQPSAAAAPENTGPARPVSEEEAERQLRGVLERGGNPAAHCTKKQYGPGWVTVCE